MKTKRTKAMLGLTLLALFIPAAGCDLRNSSYALGSFSDVLLGYDIVPSFGGYGGFNQGYEVTEVQLDFFDDSSGYGGYDDGYYHEDDYYYDDYYDDGYYYDDWKKKKAG